MVDNWQARTALLLGENKLEKLRSARVLVVGVGGVGAYAAEMICRAGVGHITIVDGDCVNVSNINRQLIALHSTVGCEKTELMVARLKDINPDLDLVAHSLFLDESNTSGLLDAGEYDYIIDAIDTIAPKINLICQALRRKIRIISSMGAGGRVDPIKLLYADISDTYHCALARVVRNRLQKCGINRGLKVVFSCEQPDKNAVLPTDAERNKKSTVGTVSYIPALFGCYLAAYVIRKIAEK